MAEVQSEAVTGRRTTPPFRADHVGSLLRPRELLDARAAFGEGRRVRGVGLSPPGSV